MYFPGLLTHVSTEPAVLDPSTVGDSTNDASKHHKSTGEKIKDALKKPFASSSSPSHHSKKSQETEVTSPELEAAQEVLAAKHLTTP